MLPAASSDYRIHAAHCFRRALAAHETDSRQAYWAMGLLWLELAARIELIAAR